MTVAVNLRPPSEDNSSGMPYVAKVRRRLSMRPRAPFAALSIMGQFEYRSTITK